MARTRSSGETGLGGVGTRCRSPIILPASSSKAALIPVPPMSIASVRGSFIARLFLAGLSGLSSFPSAAGSAFGSSLFLRCIKAAGVRVRLSRTRNGATVRRISAVAGLVALLSTVGARADGPPAPADLVTADLVAEAASITPNATLWVDLQLAIKPGWHVYWQNPGDSGLP